MCWSLLWVGRGASDSKQSRTSAFWAACDIASRELEDPFGGALLLGRRGLWPLPQESAAFRQRLSLASVGEESVVPDPHAGLRQDVK